MDFLFIIYTNFMSKVLLKNYDELEVTDQEAKRVHDDKLKPDDLNLPYTITHKHGVWIGTLRDIGTVNVEESYKPKFFLTEENKLKFHNLHGYGKYKDTYEPGYGLLDVETQYLIGAGVAKLKTDQYGRKSLITKQSPEYDKYSDYWRDYITKLDAFNEPR